ncbi:hypothetical protein NPX13_g10703 [Xylaria arbuscula]|uniref:SET domain-containing protein n=1 Tax=Xylaria arbuscula TaxID=114810 RepID=A0A9W8N490_9PEZI|nr:hypothetical protein NPX13_g10703 [Xylaria arbuscula]
MTSDLDVSMSGQTYRQAFQVRMAKEGRGRGCFAVRDVAPGECDPNVHYWVNPRSYRWVGVATRAIKKGEEMCIAYIPTHNLRFQRQAQLEERWGFRCACSKCKEGEDEYTQSLIDARNAGIPYESKRSEPAAYFEDNFDQFRDTIERRIALLREICESVKDGKEGESRRMELTFALIDGYTFHRDHWHILVQDAKDAPEDQADRIRQDLDHALIHVKQDRAYTYEALTWARRAWDPKDQMIYNLTEELRKIEATLVDMTRSGEAEAGSTPSPRHANEGAAPLFSSDPLFDSSPGDRIE